MSRCCLKKNAVGDGMKLGSGGIELIQDIKQDVRARKKYIRRFMYVRKAKITSNQKKRPISQN
jgi:hypothetical protein